MVQGLVRKQYFSVLWSPCAQQIAAILSVLFYIIFSVLNLSLDICIALAVFIIPYGKPMHQLYVLNQFLFSLHIYILCDTILPITIIPVASHLDQSSSTTMTWRIHLFTYNSFQYFGDISFNNQSVGNVDYNKFLIEEESCNHVSDLQHLPWYGPHFSVFHKYCVYLQMRENIVTICLNKYQVYFPEKTECHGYPVQG